MKSCFRLENQPRPRKPDMKDQNVLATVTDESKGLNCVQREWFVIDVFTVVLLIMAINAKTCLCISSHFYWPFLYLNVQKYCATLPTCQ